MIPLMKRTFLHEFETRQELANFILEAPRLSMDMQCFTFEEQFAAKQERKHAILFNSGGSANLALLQACRNLGLLKDDDKIGFSALTWSTNVMPIIQMGCIPVPIDCSKETLNIMSAILEEAIAKEPLRALFITNALGFTGDLDKIKALCDAKGILVLEDNCESLGTRLPAGKAGNFSLGSTFSFFVAHHMSTIEGGMVCTDDDELASMLRIVRANGWTRNLSSEERLKWRKQYKIESEFEDKYTFYDLGFNLRPTEITGFIGQKQLQYLDENCAIREQNYQQLEKYITDNEDLITLDRSHIEMLSSFAIPVICKTPELQQKYLAQFSGAGVEIRPMIAGNMLRQPFYAKYASTDYHLPDTDFIHDCGFYFGNYPELTKNDLEVLSSCLIKF